MGFDILVTDIDGVTAKIPEGLGGFKAESESCRTCPAREKENCTRPSWCGNQSRKDREAIDKIFSPQGVMFLEPDLGVRDFLILMKLSGFLVVYVTGRPANLAVPTAMWLRNNGFPPGTMFSVGSMEGKDVPEDPAERKAMAIEALKKSVPVDFVLCMEDDPLAVAVYEKRFDAVNVLNLRR